MMSFFIPSVAQDILDEDGTILESVLNGSFKVTGVSPSEMPTLMTQDEQERQRFIGISRKHAK